MSKITIIPPQTAAVSDVVYDTTTIKSDTINIIADTLANAEEVDLEVYAGNGTYKVWISNSAGAYKLTATQYMLSLPNPGTLIRVSKDVTASACGVILTYPESTKR
jgi:hypothetical protein